MSYIKEQQKNEISLFDGEYAFLSNFYSCEIVELQSGGTTITYPTVEHAYQASKTSNIDIRRKIASEATPGRAKRAGGRRGYVTMDSSFEDNKIDIMRKLLILKFLNPSLQQLLLSTGDAKLVEGNTWGDQFWGYDTRVNKGQNMLGRLLMDVRHALACINSTEPIDFKGLYVVLNPFYKFQITETQVDGTTISYPTVAHAFNAMNCASVRLKRMVAENETNTGLISPYLATEIAQLPYNRISQTQWEAERQIMQTLNILKFVQNENFRVVLELTGNREIVYSGDKFWGKVNGVGSNYLGLILMQIREDLKNGKFR